MEAIRRNWKRYALAVLVLLLGALISLGAGTANFMFPAIIVALAIIYTIPHEENPSGGA